MLSGRHKSQYTDILKRGDTTGGDLETNEDIKARYSQNLRALVMECLMVEPLHRPTAADLQTRTGEMFENVVHTRNEDPSPGLDYLEIKIGNPEPPAEWEGRLEEKTEPPAVPTPTENWGEVG